MKLVRRIDNVSFRIGVSIVLLLAGPVVFAGDGPGWYVGGGVGQSQADIDEAQFDSLAASSSTSSDEKDNGLKLFGGYRFSRNFGVEVAYVDLGKFTATQSAPSGSVDVEFEPSGWNVAGVGVFPFGDGFSLFGKLGVFRWDLDYRCTTASGALACIAPANRSASGTDLSLGLGLSYALTRNLDLRVEWERFQDVGEPNASRGVDNGKTGQSDIDLLAIGVQLKFF